MLELWLSIVFSLRKTGHNPPSSSFRDLGLVVFSKQYVERLPKERLLRFAVKEGDFLQLVSHEGIDPNRHRLFAAPRRSDRIGGAALIKLGCFSLSRDRLELLR